MDEDKDNLVPFDPNKRAAKDFLKEVKGSVDKSPSTWEITLLSGKILILEGFISMTGGVVSLVKPPNNMSLEESRENNLPLEVVFLAPLETIEYCAIHEKHLEVSE